MEIFFAGIPPAEKIRNELRFTAPLTGITAAVVGVVLNLAVFFTLHVLWPGGNEGKFDIIAACIGGLAFLLLFRFRWSLVSVIAVAALIGLLYSMI